MYLPIVLKIFWYAMKNDLVVPWTLTRTSSSEAFHRNVHHMFARLAHLPLLYYQSLLQVNMFPSTEKEIPPPAAAAPRSPAVIPVSAEAENLLSPDLTTKGSQDSNSFPPSQGSSSGSREDSSCIEESDDEYGTSAHDIK